MIRTESERLLLARKRAYRDHESSYIKYGGKEECIKYEYARLLLEEKYESKLFGALPSEVR